MAADLSDPGRFHLSERWTDAESLAAHAAAPSARTSAGRCERPAQRQLDHALGRRNGQKLG